MSPEVVALFETEGGLASQSRMLVLVTRTRKILYPGNSANSELLGHSDLSRLVRKSSSMKGG